MTKNTRPPLVVIESPFAGATPEEVAQNVEYARAAMRNALAQGEHPIASHLLYAASGVLDDDNPKERELGIEAGLAWARHADYAVLYVDRGVSPGMDAARARHENEGRPVILRAIEPEGRAALEGVRAMIDRVRESGLEVRGVKL